jgi:hypothetical protein
MVRVVMASAQPKTDHYLEPRRGKSAQRDLATEVLKVCKANKAPGPVEFMASVLAGIDPRKDLSELFELVRDIQERIDTDLDVKPTAHEWDMVYELITKSGLYERQPVHLKESLDVAKELTKYLHPQLSKQQVQSQILQVQVKPVELSDDQLDKVLDWFDDTF